MPWVLSNVVSADIEGVRLLSVIPLICRLYVIRSTNSTFANEHYRPLSYLNWRDESIFCFLVLEPSTVILLEVIVYFGEITYLDYKFLSRLIRSIHRKRYETLSCIGLKAQEPAVRCTGCQG